jgi:hypothetical protein
VIRGALQLFYLILNLILIFYKLVSQIINIIVFSKKLLRARNSQLAIHPGTQYNNIFAQ